MLFKIKASEPLADSDPAVYAIKEFEKLKDRQLRYIFLVYDYDSPFRQIPIQERKLHVAKHIGYKYDPETGKLTETEGKKIVNGDMPDILAAIKKFKELQYDEERDLLLAYDAQLSEFKNFFRKAGKTDDELTLALRISKEYQSLVASRQAMIESLGLKGDIDEEDANEEFSDENLSLIDRINMELEKL